MDIPGITKEVILNLKGLFTLSPAIIDIIFDNPNDNVVILENKIAEVIRAE